MAGAFREVFVQETGVRNPAFGVETFGLKDLKQVHWNLTEAPLYEHAIANGEAQHRRRRRAVRAKPAITPAARPRTSIRSSTR